MSTNSNPEGSPPSGWLAGQVRRAARNSLIWHGVVLGLVAIVAWLSSTYYYNFFRGPFLYDDAKLLAAAEHPGTGNLLAYIELRNHSLRRTGWEDIMILDKRVHEVIPYQMVAIGERRMLVLAKAPGPGDALVGPLYHVGQQETAVISAI